MTGRGKAGRLLLRRLAPRPVSSSRAAGPETELRSAIAEAPDPQVRAGLLRNLRDLYLGWADHRALRGLPLLQEGEAAPAGGDWPQVWQSLAEHADCLADAEDAFAGNGPAAGSGERTVPGDVVLCRERELWDCLHVPPRPGDPETDRAARARVLREIIPLAALRAGRKTTSPILALAVSYESGGSPEDSGSPAPAEPAGAVS